jgi:hypothetical protein
VDHKGYLKIFNDCVDRAGVKEIVQDYLLSIRKHAAVHLGHISARMTAAQYSSAQECVQLAEKSGLTKDEIYRLKMLCYDKTKMNGKLKGV